MYSEELLNDLRSKARLLRKDIITMIGKAGSGHPGGSLSSVEIVTALYFHELKLDPTDPAWEVRDRFILSKGHAAPLLYAALANRGFFPREEIWGLRKLGSILQGHPDRKSTPGVEMSTGSLGQGLAVSNGMAIAGKLSAANWRVYVLLGDGEVQEGMVWEAAMASSHYKLDNLTAFLDYNGLQIDGPVDEVMSPSPLADKWKAFGWNVLTIDGHDFESILDALQKARETKGKPTMIIAKTVKGKGISFMENNADWHGRAPSAEQVKQALAELEQV